MKMLQATHTKTFSRYFLRFRSMAPLGHLSGDLEDKLVRRRWPLSMNIVLVGKPHKKHALEMADTVEQSATMLLLETDPCNRGPRPSYRLWYQEIAAGYLKNALHDVEERKRALGTSAWADMLQQNKRLALLRADALLARDQIHEEIAKTKEHMANNVVQCEK